MTGNIDFYELIALMLKEGFQVSDRLHGLTSTHGNLNNLARGIALFDRTEEPFESAL